MEDLITKISSKLNSWARGWIILALFAAFVIYVAGTLPILQDAPGGSIESLDAQILYTPEEAYLTVGSYGDASLFWVGIYLTWDVINPALYSLIFSLLISWFFQRSFKPTNKFQKLNVLPVGAGVFDLLENISIVAMLLAYPTRLTVIAWFGTLFTLSKIVLLAVSMLLIFSGVVGAAINRFKKQ